MTPRLRKGMVAGVLAGLFGAVASISPPGLSLEEHAGLGILFRLRGPRVPPPDVLVVGIDRESSDRLGLSHDLKKWPRSLHARLTEVLAIEGAAVIAFDVFFEDSADTASDLAFAGAIRKANNVVLCERVERERVPMSRGGDAQAAQVEVARRIPPIAPLAAATAASAPYPLPKVPVKVSRDWTFCRPAGDAPTMPVAAFHLYAGAAYEDFLRLLERASPAHAQAIPRLVESWRLPGSVETTLRRVREIFENDSGAAKRMLALLDGPPPHRGDADRNRILRSLIRLYGGGVGKFLNYYGPARTIPTVPYFRVLEVAEGEGERAPVDIRGKAVFVGSSEFRQLAQKDGFYTVFTREDGVDLSGVEIAATAFANLIEDMPLKPLPFRIHVGVLVAWGLAVGILGFAFRPIVGFPAVAVLSLLYLGLAESRFAAAGDWYPVVFPLLVQAPLVLAGAAAWAYIDLNRERRRVRAAFECYLPPDVVDELAGNISGLRLSERMVHGICLATDAERYTSLAESTDPKELAGLMNRYYEAVFAPVKRHGGMVSNVVADSMLALWVAPKGEDAPLREACQAALDIADAVRGLKESGEGPSLATRIGLHSGEILLGNIGAVSHFEYRPVGDIVNTATRIEGLNKQLGTRILVSREILSKDNGFLTRDLGTFLLAGKSRPVHVHELMSRFEESTPAQRACCAAFAEGMEAFRCRRWDEASGRFQETIRICAGDGPSLFYLTLCARYAQSPPEGVGSWSGVVHLEGK